MFKWVRIGTITSFLWAIQMRPRAVQVCTKPSMPLASWAWYTPAQPSVSSVAHKLGSGSLTYLYPADFFM